MNRFARQTAGCLLGIALLLGASFSHAENRALLIGVSAYPELPPARQLQGPANDVVLMRDLLKSTGFADGNIRVLADNVAGAAALPTRAAILAELKALAQTAGKGDFIYLQFNGHGSQQPTRPGKATTETDGLDEILLPRDIGKWDGATGTVTNAIADEEVGAAIDAIRQRGAFVWAVFDSCHSGGVTRGGEVRANVRKRQIVPGDLGIPVSEIQKAKARVAPAASATRGGAVATKPVSPLGLRGSGGDQGGYVFFYAAQPDETTDEMDLPFDQPEPRPFGLFTFTLAQVLAGNPGATYRQLGERILQLYTAQGIRQDLTPLFEGSALDAPLFGQKSTDAIRSWPVAIKNGAITVRAGSLQQIGEGAIVALYLNVLAKPDQVLGYLKATQVGLMESRLEPASYLGKPALSTDAIPADAVVRIVEPALNLSLAVAIPASIANDCQPAQTIVAAVRSNPPPGIKIDWKAATEAADLRLICSEGQLWLAGPDGALVSTEPGKTPSIPLSKPPADLNAHFSESLQRIARATNLARIAVWGSSGSFSNKIDTRAILIRKKTGTGEPLHGDSLPTLEAGDRLKLEIENNGSRPVDITVFSIDSRYAIEPLYPLGKGELNRLGAQDVLTIPELEIDGSTAGREGLIIIAVEATPGSAPTDLTALAQAGLPATRGSCTAAPAACFLQDATQGSGQTRGEDRQAAMGRLAVKMINWNAVPAK